MVNDLLAPQRLDQLTLDSNRVRYLYDIDLPEIDERDEPGTNF